MFFADWLWSVIALALGSKTITNLLDTNSTYTSIAYARHRTTLLWLHELCTPCRAFGDSFGDGNTGRIQVMPSMALIINSTIETALHLHTSSYIVKALFGGPNDLRHLINCWGIIYDEPKYYDVHLRVWRYLYIVYCRCRVWNWLNYCRKSA